MLSLHGSPDPRPGSTTGPRAIVSAALASAALLAGFDSRPVVASIADAAAPAASPPRMLRGTTPGAKETRDPHPRRRAAFRSPAAAAVFGSGPQGSPTAGADRDREISVVPGRADSSGPATSRSWRYSPSLLGAYRKSMEIEVQIQKACDAHGLSLELARAVCMYESGCDAGLVSGAGARGYFQVMPETFRAMRVSSNIEAGVKYLSQLLRTHGREDDALAAYNGGPGRMRSGRPLPIETLQYVVGVGIYRTLLTFEEQEIRAEASQLVLERIGPRQTWEALSDATGIPASELRLYNPYLAPRPLRSGAFIAHPQRSGGLLEPFVTSDGAASVYTTRRGDNYLLLALALDLDLEAFRRDNSLWRIQVPFERMRLTFGPGTVSSATADPEAASASPAALAPPSRPTALPPSTASPGSALPGSSSSVSSVGSGARSVVHKVRRGETLYRIATRYGVSADAIRDANGLHRNRLLVGQLLTIPLG